MSLLDFREMPARVVQAMQGWRSGAPALLAVFARARPAARAVPAGLTKRNRQLICGLIESTVIPELVAVHRVASDRLPQARPLVHARSDELARRLIATDPGGAVDLLELLWLQADSLAAFCARVIEPAARGLGDLWAADACSDFDVILGLARLQSALQRPYFGDARAQATAGARRAVLVVCPPGEPHALGAVLDAELLQRAGWEVHCEFPATDGELQELVAARWCDAIDLASSLALRRDHLLPRMARSIGAVRAASRNPALVVVASGRSFFELEDRHGAVAADLGADACCPTAAQVGTAITQVLGRR